MAGEGSPPVAERALERGVGFLLGEQGADGLWRDFRTPAGEASEWPTGYIGTALLNAGADGYAIDSAAQALLVCQNADGGWGYNESVPSDADSTACCLRFLSEAGHHDEPCRRAARLLVSHQRRGIGGIATYRRATEIRQFMGVGRWMPFTGWCRPHSEVTAAAGYALAASACTESARPARAAWRYVRSQQRRDGSWASYWWTSPHYATAQASEFALLGSDVRACARAAEWAVRHQNDDGTWRTTCHGRPAIADGGSAFATALGLTILILADMSGPPVERAVNALVGLQSASGSWPSHPIMRIPLPFVIEPDRRRWRPIRIGGGVVVEDQHRTFTSATCVAALALALARARGATSGRGPLPRRRLASLR